MNLGTPIRVLVADDHTPLRQEIVRTLKACERIQVVGEASDGEEATRLAFEARPDIVVLDLNMPKVSGFEAVRRILFALPRTRVLVLTAHEEEEYVIGSVMAGASGYMTKDAAPCELIAGILAIGDGRYYFGASANRALEKMARRRPRAL